MLLTKIAGKLGSSGWTGMFFLLAIACALMSGCSTEQTRVAPSIEFSKVPVSDDGGPQKTAAIEGRVIGARPGQQIVLFARSREWYVQPLISQPFTKIQPDSTWKSSTHLGTEYAALLVESGYRPPNKMDELPKEGAGVVVVAKTPGNPSAKAVGPTLQFCGYEWTIRTAPSDSGGKNFYDPANAWTDERGALHLRIAGSPDHWTGAQVILRRSLGYGTYRFVVRDTSNLDPAAMLDMYTYEAAAANENHRRVDIQISRWGDPANKNAQFMLEPSYFAGNKVRFEAPGGALTHLLRWESGRVSFKTVRGSGAGANARPVAEHSFSAGVPAPGNETVRIHFYDFQRGPRRMQKGAEVIIDKFEYIP